METGAQKRDRMYKEAVQADKQRELSSGKTNSENVNVIAPKKPPMEGMGGYGGRGDRARKIYTDTITEEDHQRGYTSE